MLLRRVYTKVSTDPHNNGIIVDFPVLEWKGLTVLGHDNPFVIVKIVVAYNFHASICQVLNEVVGTHPRDYHISLQ